MKFSLIGGNGFDGIYFSKELSNRGYDVFIKFKKDDLLFKVHLGIVIYARGVTSSFNNKTFWQKNEPYLYPSVSKRA